MTQINMLPDDFFRFFVVVVLDLNFTLALLLEHNVVFYSLYTLKSSQFIHSFIYSLIPYSASGFMLATWDSIIHKNTHGHFPLEGNVTVQWERQILFTGSSK